MYGYNNFGNTYVPPIQPRPMYMSQQEMEQPSPFNIVKFVNEKEANGYVLLPNQRALLMDTQNMHKSDCVCRAISTAMDMDYYEVENLLYKNSKYQSCDTLTKSCYRNLLEKEFGLQSHYGRGRTVREIAYRYPHNRVIMRIYGHLTTSINGECLDTFDCTDKIVDEYWVIY